MTIYKNQIDSLSLGDSSIVQLDTIDSSSLQKTIISKDAILDKIDAEASDSTVLDHLDKKMYLYGNAVVKYQTMELKAGKIIIDYEKNEAMAFPAKDSLARMIDKPHFKDGDNDFTCDQLRYNFDSKKGMVYKARTKENDLYVLGERTKFISKDADSTLRDDVIYTENALVTSCEADHPHFGILAKKLKVIPGKVAIVGPSWLKIMDIPLIPLPFGFFPMSKGRSTGLIFPKNFEVTPTLKGGVRMNGIGWYFPLNDHVDLQILADLTSRGDWGVRTVTNYNIKYKYKGQLNLNYSKSYQEDEFGIRRGAPAFAFKLRHSQDNKAHPYRKISGSVNISTKGYYQRDQNDARTQRKNTYTSNFGLSYSVPNSPISFSLDMRHEQNTNTKLVKIELPVAKMRLSTIYPFKSSSPGSNSEKWYERISFAYNAEISNKIVATDSTLFSQETLSNMQNGMRQHAETGLSFKLFKYFNLNFKAKIDENWTLKTLHRYLDDRYDIKTDSIFDELDSLRFIGLESDTLKYGIVEEEYINGFATQRDYGGSVSLSTKFFATYQRKKGFFRGIRHTFSPSVSVVYNPDTKSLYEQEYLNDLRAAERDTIYYSPFEKAVYRQSLRKKGLNLAYSFGNLFEAKFFSKKDTIAKKIKLFNSINVNGSYNVAADSLNWSRINISANTPLFWGWSNLNIRGTLDPYKEVNNRRVNELAKFPEVESFSFTLSTAFQITKLLKLFSKEKVNKKDKGGSPKTTIKPAKSKITSLIESFRITHNFTYLIQRNDNLDTLYTSVHSIGLTGVIPVSENWSIDLRNISYDFVRKKVNYPQLNFTRKLHCWTMSFGWSPYRDSFNFVIGVNSSTLGFLKRNYGKNQSFGSFY